MKVTDEMVTAALSIMLSSVNYPARECLHESDVREILDAALGSLEKSDVMLFAVAAERERCAQIADAHASLCSSKLNKKRSDHDLAVFESAASEAMSIAATIRENVK